MYFICTMSAILVRPPVLIQETWITKSDVISFVEDKKQTWHVFCCYKVSILLCIAKWYRYLLIVNWPRKQIEFNGAIQSEEVRT